jgi:hypothetical protein
MTFSSLRDEFQSTNAPEMQQQVSSYVIDFVVNDPACPRTPPFEGFPAELPWYYRFDKKNQALIRFFL